MIKKLKNHAILADGTVFRRLQAVPESMVHIREGRIRLHNWKGLLRLSLSYRHQKLNQAKLYVSIHNSYSGYYHWLLECLPKLLEAKKVLGDFTLLLPDSYRADFHNDTLRLLGVSEMERLLPATVYRVPELVLPYFDEPMGSYSAAVLEELRSTLLHVTHTARIAGGPTRLYVSRRKAERRKVVNEPAVEALMHEFGFQAVCFEDYTFAQQVQLCANAEALVSIHGAGLSNMLFLPTGAAVIEFRKFDAGENCFFSELAATLRHQYHLQYCAAAEEGQSVQDADVVVPIDELRTVLAQQF
jgi:capsular polysaccharide biosynthesis protein